MEKYSHEKYINLISGKRHFWDVPEQKYKNKFVPKYLYKYWSLDSHYIDVNLKNILDGKIWMPNALTLNDPFEFQMIKDCLSENKRLEFRNDILGRNSVLSLASSPKNYLMWSHYGNAHKGICLEFKVNDKNNIYPVVYVDKQEDLTADIQEWLECKGNLVSKNPVDWSDEERKLMEKVHKTMIYKMRCWSYEEEFRIIGREFSDDSIWGKKIGYAEQLSSLGLELSRIILGFNCMLENKGKVIQYVNDANEIKVMNNMIEKDFKYSKEAVIKNMLKEESFIKVAQIKRNNLSLVLQNLKYKEGIYSF